MACSILGSYTTSLMSRCFTQAGWRCILSEASFYMYLDEKRALITRLKANWNKIIKPYPNLQEKQFGTERSRMNTAEEGGINQTIMNGMQDTYLRDWWPAPVNSPSCERSIFTFIFSQDQVCYSLHFFPISSEVLKELCPNLCCNNFPIYPNWKRRGSCFQLTWNLCISKTMLTFHSCCSALFFWSKFLWQEYRLSCILAFAPLYLLPKMQGQEATFRDTIPHSLFWGSLPWW